MQCLYFTMLLKILSIISFAKSNKYSGKSVKVIFEGCKMNRTKAAIATLSSGSFLSKKYGKNEFFATKWDHLLFKLKLSDSMYLKYMV